MENYTFSYKYSAATNKEVESIRNKYIPREETKLERLKRLDRKAQNAGTVEGLCLGIIGVLVFGIGICIMLGAIEGSFLLSYICCTAGIALMLPAYPVYRYLSKKVKTALTPEILKLSDELIQK